MIDWQRFGADVAARTPRPPVTERLIGISHARLHGARAGRPVGTDIYLALCAHLGLDPLAYYDAV